MKPRNLGIEIDSPDRNRSAGKMRGSSRGRAASMPAWMPKRCSEARCHRACKVDHHSIDLGARVSDLKMISGFISGVAVEAIMNNMG